MSLNKGKHNVTEVEGVRCTVIETGVKEERALFLKKLLEFNNFEVKMEKEKAKDGTPLNTWTVGITDIVFNPVIAVYQRQLKRPEDGHIVTPAYWNQWDADWDAPYFTISR
ncbi:MAG: hypothetical protein Q8867_05985 [Bacteroidota bacterium]|nr:hypothetical protein [Bacteroidota bacterium]